MLYWYTKILDANKVSDFFSQKEAKEYESTTYKRPNFSFPIRWKMYEVVEGSPRGMLRVIIFEPGTVAKINEISKVSKPGRRVYSSADDLPTVKSGRGMIIVSTSKGLMTGREAKKQRLGGEILVKVW